MCDHDEFEATVTFQRLAADQSVNTITGLIAEARAVCAVCGDPVVWIVPDTGLRPDRPTVSPDGQELRVPCWVTPAPPSS